MQKSGSTALVCCRADHPNVGMSLAKNLGRYKLYMADTGLFVTMAFWDKDDGGHEGEELFIFIA